MKHRNLNAGELMRMANKKDPIRNALELLEIAERFGIESKLKQYVVSVESILLPNRTSKDHIYHLYMSSKRVFKGRLAIEYEHIYRALVSKIVFLTEDLLRDYDIMHESIMDSRHSDWGDRD